VLGENTEKNMKNQSFAQRFGYAVGGLRTAFRTEASFRTQLLLAVVAAATLAWVRPPWVWVALCIVSAAAVLATELVNTALEHLADRLHPEQHPTIRAAKDCAAAAVLLASIAAVIIGVLALAVGLHLLNPPTVE
jgi:diacylglycerol kinase (ATP)